MTYLLFGNSLGIIIGAIAVWHLTKKLREAYQDSQEAFILLTSERKKVLEYEQHIYSLANERDRLKENLESEKMARSRAEKHREELLAYLVTIDNPHDLAIAINNELRALSQMSASQSPKDS